MINDFQANRDIIKLIEQQENYREVIHLCSNIYECLTKRNRLSKEEQNWLSQLKKFLPDSAES
jgi:hypothetical protein